MNIIMERFYMTDEGTFSVASINGEFLGYTVEQPWNDNRPFESCVPEGEYELVPYNSPKYGLCYLLDNPKLNVYAYEHECKEEGDRYLCIFVHKGNYPRNFQGCIGIGEDFLEKELMVTNTTNTCKDVLDTIKDFDNLSLTIRDNHVE